MDEPSDGHMYGFVTFFRETADFFVLSLNYYIDRLRQDLEFVQKDDLLKDLFGKELLERLPITEEIEKATAVRDMVTKELDGHRSHFPIHLQVNHWWARFVKSACLLYLSLLKQRRNRLAMNEHLSKYGLEAVDQQLAKIEQSLNTGIFQTASALPLMVSQVMEAQPASGAPAADSHPSVTAVQVPVILGSIEILDPELRSRCLDLFGTFRQSQQNDRLDTVLTEATRILEDRLRRVSGAPPEVTGVDLATFAFKAKPVRIQLSAIDAEQDAAHLLYRGMFGFVRNQVHHKLLGELRPERVLQVIGMTDYLISLLEGRVVPSP